MIVFCVIWCRRSFCLVGLFCSFFCCYFEISFLRTPSTGQKWNFSAFVASVRESVTRKGKNCQLQVNCAQRFSHACVRTRACAYVHVRARIFIMVAIRMFVIRFCFAKVAWNLCCPSKKNLLKRFGDGFCGIKWQHEFCFAAKFLCKACCMAL